MKLVPTGVEWTIATVHSCQSLESKWFTMVPRHNIDLMTCDLHDVKSASNQHCFVIHITYTKACLHFSHLRQPLATIKSLHDLMLSSTSLNFFGSHTIHVCYQDWKQNRSESDTKNQSLRNCVYTRVSPRAMSRYMPCLPPRSLPGNDPETIWNYIQYLLDRHYNQQKIKWPKTTSKWTWMMIMCGQRKSQIKGDQRSINETWESVERKPAQLRFLWHHPAIFSHQNNSPRYFPAFFLAFSRTLPLISSAYHHISCMFTVFSRYSITFPAFSRHWMPSRLESPSRHQSWPSNMESEKMASQMKQFFLHLLAIKTHHTAFHIASCAGAAGVPVAFPNMFHICSKSSKIHQNCLRNTMWNIRHISSCLFLICFLCTHERLKTWCALNML